MLTMFGLDLGTPFQGGSFLMLASILGFIVRAWIHGAPDRQRADNEGRKIDVDEHTQIRTDYVEQLREFRSEVHKYRNELQAVQGELRVSEKQIDRATSIISNYEDDRRTMLFLIRLLIVELERLDPDSIIVAQAKLTLEQMGQHFDDTTKSGALNTAEHAVADAKQTVRSATAACEEVKATEGKL